MATAATVARLTIQILANGAGAISGLKTVERAVAGFGRNILGILGSIGVAFGAGMFARAGLRTFTEMERMQASFAGMLGDAEQARSMLEQIRTFSRITPFSAKDLAEAGRTMLQYGVSAEQILPTLEAVTNVTGGNAEAFQNMALAYGQTAAMGRLMGQELRQMINAGFNPLQEISRMTGVSMDELKRIMEEGGISAQLVAMAFQSATHGTGRFAGQTAAMAQTLGGRFQQLANMTSVFAARIVKDLEPALTGLIAMALRLVQSLGTIDTTTVRNIASFTVFAGTFITVAYAISTVVKAGVALYQALKLIAAGEATVMALAGPEGWVVLGLSVAAAAGAAYYVTSQFDAMADSMVNIDELLGEVTSSIRDYNEESQKSAMIAELNAGQAAKAEESRLQSLKSKAEQIRESMRTPVEVFRDTIGELREMFEREFIDENIFSRAIEKATDDFMEASRAVKATRLDAGPGTSAAVVGTSEGSRAIAEAQRLAAGMAAQRAVSERQLEAQRQANAILREIRDKPTPPPVELEAAGV